MSRTVMLLLVPKGSKITEQNKRDFSSEQTRLLFFFSKFQLLHPSSISNLHPSSPIATAVQPQPPLRPITSFSNLHPSSLLSKVSTNSNSCKLQGGKVKMKFQRIDSIFKVFDEMLHKDVVAWNTLLSCFLRCGKPDEAIHVLLCFFKGFGICNLEPLCTYLIRWEHWCLMFSCMNLKKW